MKIKKFNELNEGLFKKDNNFDKLILKIIEYIEDGNFDKIKFNDINDVATLEFQGKRFVINFKDYLFFENPIKRNNKIKKWGVCLIKKDYDDNIYIVSKYNVKLIKLLYNNLIKSMISDKKSEINSISDEFDLDLEKN